MKRRGLFGVIVGMFLVPDGRPAARSVELDLSKGPCRVVVEDGADWHRIMEERGGAVVPHMEVWGNPEASEEVRQQLIADYRHLQELKLVEDSDDFSSTLTVS